MSLIARMLRLALGVGAAMAGSATAALAQKAPFDLAGPALEASVTRAGATLPIGQVPNLAAGDAIAIAPDLPPGQAARYVLVVAFLRGATDPPPKAWFFAAKTWRRGRGGGLDVVVPAGAQQAVIFLAPATEGDFDTLRGAVRSRPGAFVRASQDLWQLGLDRGRLGAYLDAVRRTERDEPATLQPVSTALARTLGIKLDPTCFQKTADLQAPCLMKDQDSLVLDDPSNPSLVRSLSTGASADLMTQLGAAPQIGGGAYSPYVGAVLDIARLLDSLRTARYQYVPALEAAEGEALRLRLNTAPSFGATKSVLVAALPPVETAQLPDLHASEPDRAYCLRSPDNVLAVDGAPLAFSTAFAQGLALRLTSADGRIVEVPARADPERGGFAADTSGLPAEAFGAGVEARLHGRWGFVPFEGPAFRFQAALPGRWRLAADDRAELVAARAAPVRLTGGAAACVSGVDLATPDGPSLSVAFKATSPSEITLTAPLVGAQAGPAAFRIASLGLAAPDAVEADIVAEATRLDRFEIHAGDASGMLFGQGLGAVSRLSLGGVRFVPADDPEPGGRRTLVAADGRAAAQLPSGRRLIASVAASGGRALRLPVTVLAARPRIALVARSLGVPARPPALPIVIDDGAAVPSGVPLTFSIRAEPPTLLTGQETIEVATAAGATATLRSGDGLILADAHVALARLDPAQAFGPSAFGPLRFRLATPAGASDWADLGILARLPSLTALDCAPAAPRCALAGADLFLAQAVASDPAFADAVAVPEGFTGAAIAAPRPRDGRLYLKLRDDPAVVAVVVVPPRGARAEARKAALKP